MKLINPIRTGTIAILILTVLIGANATAQVQDPQARLKALYNEARFDVLDDKLESAISRLDKLLELEPEYLKAILLKAKVLALLDRFDEAIKHYEIFLSRDPQLYGVLHFEVAFLYLKQKRMEPALAHFKAAESVDLIRALKEQGLTLFRAGEFWSAVEAFSRIDEAGPDISPEMRQEFHYLAAQALIGSAKHAAALERLEKAIQLAPDSKLATDLVSLRDQVAGHLRTTKPWRVYYSLGYRYDSNVYQDSFEDNPAAQEPTGQSDSALAANLNAEVRLVDREGYQVWFGGGANRLDYLTETDASYTGLSAQAYLTKSWSNGGFRLPYNFAHYFSGTGLDSRVSIHSANPSFYWLAGPRFRTEIDALYQRKIYHDGTPNAHHLGVGAAHFYTFAGPLQHIRFGYRFDYENPDEENDGYKVWQLMLGGGLPLWKELLLDINLALSFYFYETRPGSNFGIGGTAGTADFDRSDTQFSLAVQLKYPILRNLLVSLGYYFTTNDSNVDTGAGYDPYHFRKSLVIVSLFGTF